MMNKKPVFLSVFIALNSTIAQSNEEELDDLIDQETVQMVSGYDQSLRAAPASAIVITRDEIDKMGAYRLSDVLERVDGLHISPSSDAVATVTTIRGIQSTFLILYNGVPLAQGLVNAVGNIDSILLHDIERIEVLKGPNSSVYGADAVIGTVNLITRSPDKPYRSGGITVGNEATYNFWAGQASTMFDRPYSIYLGYHQTDGPDARIDADRQSGFDLLLGTQASLAPSFANQEREITEFRYTLDITDGWQWRNFIYDQRNLGTGVGNSQALDPMGENNYTLYNSELIYNGEHHNWDITSNLMYSQIDASGDNARLLPPGAFGGAFPEGVIQNLGVQEKRVRYELSAFRDFKKHNVRLGAGYWRNRWTNEFDRRNYTLQPGSPLLIPVGPVTEFKDTSPIFSDLTTSVYFLYLQDEWRIHNDWRLTTGVRFDDYSTFGSTINQRHGLIWNAGLDTTIKFLYGQAFRPPSTIESSSNGLFTGLKNENLDPAELDMFEINLTHRFENDVTVSASVFRYSFDDLIVLTENPASPNGQGFTNLSGSQDGHGSDLTLNWPVNDRLTLSAGWAYQSSDILDVDSRARFAAKHMPRIEVDIKLPQAWHLNLHWFGVYDRERIVNDSREDIDDYDVVNLSLSKKNVWNGLDVSLNVRNLFDEDAREPISNAIIADFPVYDRHVFLNLSLDF